MSQEKGAVSTLLPGEHDLTPEDPFKRQALKYKYNLIVNEDGTALCRAIASSQDSKYRGLKLEGSKGERVSGVGGKVINLPQDQEVLLIAARRADGRTGLYEAIMYFPGLSPRLAV